MRRIAVALLAATLLVCSPTLLTAQPRLSADPRPYLEINGSDANGAEVFGGATWATRLDDGSIVIADGPSTMLRWFDATGSPMRTAGRVGEGPGDFRLISWIGHCHADSVYAWDLIQSRLSVFDEKGNFARVISVAPTGGARFVSSCNRAGAFAIPGREAREPSTGRPDPAASWAIVRTVSSLEVVDASGSVIASDSDMLGTELVRMTGDARRRIGAGGMPRPLGRSAIFALERDHLLVGIPDSAAIAVFTLDGKRSATLPLNVPSRAPTKQQYQHAAEQLLSFVPMPMRQRTRDWILSVPMPETLPATSALFADPGGRVWAQLSMPGDPETRLRALSADGRMIADIIIPQSLTVFEIGRDYILGLHEDEDGEQHVLLYRLRGPGSGSSRGAAADTLHLV